MQTEVATDDTQNGSELEARKWSAQKWRKRFIWLPIILSILMVPGCVVAIKLDSQAFRITGVEVVWFAVVWAIFSLMFVLPPMWFLAGLVGTPFIYSSTKLFFAAIGAAASLSIAIGCQWILIGGFIAMTDPMRASEEADAHYILLAAWFLLLPAAAITAIVGGILGLLYGWFTERRR